MNEQTTDPGSQRDNGEGSPSPIDAPPSAAQHLGDAQAYASTLRAAKADARKPPTRRWALAIAMGIIAAITGAAMLITAAVLLINGLATGIGRIFDPDKVWLGQLIVGLLFVVGANVAVFLMIRKMMRASRDQTVQKYESRHNQ